MVTFETEMTFAPGTRPAGAAPLDVASFLHFVSLTLPWLELWRVDYRYDTHYCCARPSTACMLCGSASMYYPSIDREMKHGTVVRGVCPL